MKTTSRPTDLFNTSAGCSQGISQNTFCRFSPSAALCDPVFPFVTCPVQCISLFSSAYCFTPFFIDMQAIFYTHFTIVFIFFCAFLPYSHVHERLFVYNKYCFCTVQKAGLHTCKTCLCMNILLFLTYFLLQNGRYFTSSLLRYIPMPRKLLFCRCATDGSGFKNENKISSVSYTENFILYNIAISIQKHLLSSKWLFHKKIPPVYRVSTFWVGGLFSHPGKTISYA